MRPREPAWCTQYEQPLFSPLLGLEQEAAVITSYSMYHVPALLQTEGYARPIIKGIERRIEPDALDQRVEARLHRQLLDRETPFRCRVLLDEAVLRRQVGGLSVMRAQLARLLELIENERAVVQVIPFDVGAHASTDSNFYVLEFGENSTQRCVCQGTLHKQISGATCRNRAVPGGA